MGDEGDPGDNTGDGGGVGSVIEGEWEPVKESGMSTTAAGVGGACLWRSQWPWILAEAEREPPRNGTPTGLHRPSLLARFPPCSLEVLALYWSQPASSRDQSPLSGTPHRFHSRSHSESPRSEV